METPKESSQRRGGAKLTVIEGGVERVATEIVDSAFNVHSYFGSGLLESVYELSLCHELEKRDIQFQRQVEIPVYYDGVALGTGFRVDIIVDNKILIEAKACEKLLPVHRAQTLSYLRLANLPLGFLINFNVPIIKNGIVRIINDKYKPSE